MSQTEEIGFQIHTLSKLIRRQTDRLAFRGEEDPEITGKPGGGLHGWIIGYLYHHRDLDVFQRDVQEAFSIRRSTVTGILQLMEKRGLVTRSSVESDARLKKITLTPKAIAMHENIVNSIQKTEKSISRGLTEEEKQTFLRICGKIRANLESELPEKPGKGGPCDD